MTTYYVDGLNGNDANAGTSPGSGNAWATFSKATATVTAGDTVYVKSSAVYNETVTLATSGSAVSFIRWIGYSSSPGDGGMATVEGGNARSSCLALNGKVMNTFENFILQGATSNPVLGSAGGGDDCILYSCKLLRGSGTATTAIATGSFNNLNYVFLNGCEIAHFTGDGLGTASTRCGIYAWFCEIHDNGGHGTSAATFRGGVMTIGCLIYKNTGCGVFVDATSGGWPCIGCTIDGNGSDGYQINDGADTTLITNTIISNNGGYGINFVNVPSGVNYSIRHFVALYNNTSGPIHNAAYGIAFSPDITLSADPYILQSGSNYALNTTAGGGALLRAAGFPGAFPGGTTTGYPDIGAVQHADPVSGGVSRLVNGGLAA